MSFKLPFLIVDTFASLACTSCRDKETTVDMSSPDLGPQLHKAILLGQHDEVKALLSKNAKVEAQDEYGLTALQAAAGIAPESIVRTLLESGADVNAGSPGDMTALHRAALNARSEVMLLLLEAGAEAVRPRQISRSLCRRSYRC